jgi:flagellar biosynthesis/type III secretory pathway protein FliH
VGQQHEAELQRQGRMAQYRHQQEYLGRLREQHMRLQNDRHDYNNDPYFYTGWNYRYYRGGRYYETNQYGANLLREAVNYGYEQGFRAGQADRQDRWRPNYRDSYAYQDANYGYGGYYVPQGEYNYYFREGFRRGYEDGYYGRYQYGRYSSGKYTILGAILGSILDMELRR